MAVIASSRRARFVFPRSGFTGTAPIVDRGSTVDNVPAGRGVRWPKSVLETAGVYMQVCACIFSRVSNVFDALAAPARRAILDELCERDGQALFEICTRLTMKHELALTRQAISQHLDVLERAGLVRTRRDGRCKFHYIDTRPLAGIAERWSIERRQEPDDEDRGDERVRG